MPGYLSRLAAVLALLLGASAATAHDYWLEPDGQDYLLYRGHRYSQHQGEAVVPYEPPIVNTAICVDRTGGKRRVSASRSYPVRIPGPCAAVLVEANSGYWTQTLTGTKNQPRDEVFGALRSWRAIEGVKRIESWKPEMERAVSDGLELVSTTDPFALRPGDKLRLLVTWKGQPRGGVTVAYDGDPRGVSGSDGRINIRLRHGGTQVITASVDEPSNDPKSDKLVRSTALMFDLR
jgi:nickel transport protein